MVSEPDIDDTEEAWNDTGHGTRYQFTDEHVAITKVSHVGNYNFAYFTPAELDELIDKYDTSDGRFYNLDIERTGYDDININHLDGGHIVHVSKDDLQTIVDEWGRGQQSFVEYLKGEYGEKNTQSVEPSDGLRYGSEFDAAIVKHNGLFYSSLARKIATDNNVSLATTYSTDADSDWITHKGGIVMGLRDERESLTLEDINVYPFAEPSPVDYEDECREADGAFGTYTHNSNRRLVTEKNTEADDVLSQFYSRDGTYCEDENPLDCL